MKITALETYTHVRQAYLLIYFVCVVMYVFRCVSNEKKNTFSSRKMSFIFFILSKQCRSTIYTHNFIYPIFIRYYYYYYIYWFIHRSDTRFWNMNQIHVTKHNIVEYVQLFITNNYKGNVKLLVIKTNKCSPQSCLDRY